MSIKLIVGLGNPGPEYEKTRHNAGVWFIDAITSQYPTTLKNEKKFHGHCGKTHIAGQEVYLLIPNTFMNRSGLSVSALCNFYKIKAEEILVAHDELDLEPGSARLKCGGGHGGHNGLRDIIAQMGSKEFHRLRLGIGHPGDKSQVTSYVLSKPAKSEANAIEQCITDCLTQLDKIVSGDHQAAMNLLHRN